MKVNRSLVRFGAVAALVCCAFASFGASSSETPGWTPSYPAGFTERKTIAAFGDSITAGSESHGDTCRSANYEGGSMKGKTTVLAYPYWLSRMVPSDFNVISTARPEMVTDSILGWQGSVDMRLVDSVTLPKGGGTVACKVWFWDEASQSLKSSLNNKRNKGLEVPTSISGWVYGHHVTYVRDGKMMLYSKDEASVTLPAGAKFVPDFHYMYADSIQLLFAGHNDSEASWQYNLEMLKKAVATIPSKRFIVITSPCFTRPDRKAAFIKEFGADRYLDCYELLSTKGIQQARDLGLLKQSELDHLEEKNGVWMLNDDLYYPGKAYPAWYVLLTGGNYSKPGPHMNALGHFIVAKALHEKLLKNGWITQAKHTHAFPKMSEANSVSPPSSTEKVSYPKACGDGIALRFCTAEGCAETTAEASHAMYPGGHAWVDASDECCNWLCDEKKSQPGHEHTYGAWTTNPAPTCVKSGTRTQSCTVAGCTAKKTETVAALGHDFKETSSTATQVNYMCSRCTATKTELLDHTHTYGAWTTNPPPTCVEGGLRTRTCTGEGCEEKIEEELPPTGHVWIETQRQAGEIHYECANCPEVKMEFYDEPVEPQKEGDPDASAVTYTWKGGATGVWAEAANWQANATPAFGYPDSYAFATADFSGDATVDLEGCSFSLANLTMAAGANVTLASGSLANAATVFVSEGGSLTLRDVTLTQTRITPAKNSTLVLAGNCRLVTGKTGADGLRPFNKGGETIRVVDGETTISSTSTDASCKSGGTLEIDNATLTVEAHFQIKNLSLSLRDGADRAARLAVGKNANINFPKIDLVLPATGWAEAPIAVGTTATVSSGIEIAVDATACTSAGTYPLLSSGTLTLPEEGLSAIALNATCASGFSASLAVSGNTLNLVLASGSEEPPAHEHTWGEGSVTTEPTCVTPGVRTFHCSGCTETKTEQIAIDPDNHLWATEPYKTEGGFDYYKCTRTGCTAEKQEKAEEPGPGPEPEPLGEDWGWSNRVTVAGTDYCVLAFTNTAASGLAWTVPTGVTAFRYLVVGGGGSGGSGGKASSSTAGGGGGGAGGLREGEVASAPAGSAYVIRVGAGGLAPTEAAVDGGDGSDSSISQGSETVACARGGGGGGAGVYINSDTPEGRRGHDGGCGGGGGGCNTNDAVTAVMVPAGGAALDAEAGFGGGSGSLRAPGNNQSAGGGGGGAGAAGGKAAYNSPGAGGDGKVSDITGADVCYAGGGSGAFGKSGTKAGGAGGGGTGGATPTAGVDGLGAGGGGARGVGAGNGGNGIVIIRYAVPGGEEPPTHEHAWGEGSVTTEPTCVTPGVRTFHCSGCTETKTEQIAIDPDNHLWATVPYKTEGGYAYYTCTRTGCTAEKQEKVEEPRPGPEPLGADWGWSNRVTVAGTDYCVLAFTNTAASGFAWTVPSGVKSIDYLVVGGGGGGGGARYDNDAYSAGGGGAGGLILSKGVSVAAGTTVTVKVGDGGVGGDGKSGGRTKGGNGGESSLKVGSGDAVVAKGGGGGGVPGTSSAACAGQAGGSGGGGAVTKGTGGSGTDGQGTAGGTATGNGASNVAGGGGGAGGAGANGSDGGAGGVGVADPIGGTEVVYAAGGAGGSGGNAVLTTNAVAATGNGGMGASAFKVSGVTTNNQGGRGGSGIVIIRYAVSGGEEPGPGPGPGPGPEPTEYEYGEPDGETAVTYTWKGGAAGAWANPANWQADQTPCYGIPSNKVATAVFAADVVVDLANGAYPVVDITINGASTVEVKGGTIGHSSVQFKYDGAGSTLRLRDAHLVSNRIGVGDSTCFECVGASTLAGAQNYGFRPWGNSGHVLYVHDGETTVSEMHGYTKSSDRGLVKVENAVLSVAPSACDLTAGYDLSLDAVSRLAVKSASLTYAFGTTTLTLPAGGWANSPVYAYRAATLSADIAFVVDATACTTPGSYPLITSDTAVMLPEGGLSALTLNATCASGLTAALAADAKTIYLVVSEGGSEPGVLENRWLDKPSLEKTSWNEDVAPSAVNPGRPAYGRVLVTYDYGVTEIPVAPGEHVAHFVVEPATGWTGLSADIDFTIADTAPQPGEVKLPEGFDAAHTIVCYGDSITEGYSSTNVTLGVCPNYHDGRYNGKGVKYSYPYVLSQLVPSGYNVVNQSHGGMETDAILAWQGGVMVRSTADITLKANGTSYTSCPTNLLFDGRSIGTADSDRCKGMQSPTLSAFGATEDIVSGWMNGQHVAFNGGARWNDAKLRLYGPAESDVTIPAGSRFIPDNAIAYKDAVQVIFVGQNDKVANYRRYLPLIRQAVAKITSQRYVVVSTHSSRSEEMEAAFAEAFGQHYLNLYQEMDTRGLETALALGIMPQEDYDSREAFAETKGYPMWYWYLTENSSVSGGDARKYPGIHFNSKGYRVTGQFIYEKLNALGYLNDSPSPEEPEVVVPGEASKTYSDEAAAQAAAAKAEVGVPAAVAAKLDAAQQAEYVKCFNIVTRKTADSQWVNEAVLTEAAEAALQEQVDQGAVKVLSSLDESALTLSPVTPGFYYTLVFGETLGGMTSRQTEMATAASGLMLDLPKGQASGFYRVVASERQ